MMSHRPPTLSAARRHGFSFVEILFAVAVMGIGFIMIAAAFPIGLQQTKLNMDETNGAAGSRSMAARLQQIGQSVVPYVTGYTRAALPQTYDRRGLAAPPVGLSQFNGQVRTLNDPRAFVDTTDVGGLTPDQINLRRYNMWQSVANDLVNPSDPRNASVVMFRRDTVAALNTTTNVRYFTGAATAQVIVFNTQVANQSGYTAADVSKGTPATVNPHTMMDIFNLEARPVAVQVMYDPTNQVWVASFFSVTKLTAGSGGATYDRGGYPSGATPNDGNTWDKVLDAAVGAVGEGAFFVISDDRIIALPASAGRLNGHIYRIGQRRTDLSGLTFDLAPGYSFVPDAGVDGFLNTTSTPSSDDLVSIGLDSTTTTGLCGLTYTAKPFGANDANGTTVRVAGSIGGQGAVALVLGRGFSQSQTTPITTDGYTGPVQDVSAYTTFVSVPKQ